MLPDHSQDYHIGWPRAFQTGVAILSACAFGALAYGYSGGPGGGRGTAPTPTAASEAFYEQVGPNYDAGWGMSAVFILDPTQADQSVLNSGITQNNTGRWVGITSPVDSGGFFNVSRGDTTVAEFIFPSGSTTRVAWTGVSGFPDSIYCDTYVRATYRNNAAWQYSGGTIKHFFFRRIGQTVQNVTVLHSTPAGGGSGQAPNLFNIATPGDSASALVSGDSTYSTDGAWWDAEYRINIVGDDSARVQIWQDGTLTADTTPIVTMNSTGIGAGIRGWDLLQIGPYHGGSTAQKTQQDTVQYSRLIIYAKVCP